MDQLNGAAMFPDPDQAPSKELMGHFRRLARSSPWLWNTIQIEISAHDPEHRAVGFAAENQPESLTVLIRRPNAVRVEDPAGKVLFRTDTINDSEVRVVCRRDPEVMVVAAAIACPRLRRRRARLAPPGGRIR